MHCDSVELDIWLTKDKEIIVIHGGFDGHLELEGSPFDKVFFKDMTLEQAKSIIINGETIPTLREVFDLLKPYKTHINVEVKERNTEVCQILLDLIQETDMWSLCYLSTLVQPVIDEFARIGIKGKLHISKVFNEEYDILKLPADINDLLNMNIEGISIRAAEVTPELAEWCN